MKAMLYADWMNFRQQMRTIVLVVVFCLVIATSTGQPAMFSCMLVVASYLFPNTIFAVEQSSGWDKLSLSMPVLRREVVASRFLLTLAVNAAMLVRGLLFSVVFCTLWDNGTTLGECVASALGGEIAALVLLSLQMTAAFKWGIQKSGYVLLGFFCLIMLIPVSVFTFGALDIDTPHVSAFMTWLFDLDDLSFLRLELGCVAAALAVYAICYLISVRIYQKKEL